MDSRFKPIDSLEELDRLFELSDTAPVVLFKHSSTCGTSFYINELMETVTADVHRVIVQDRRDVSNYIADRTGVRHQSPQVFVIRGRKVVYSASHYSITPDAVANAVAAN
jgi:bacillithiol system protein YtxJ